LISFLLRITFALLFAAAASQIIFAQNASGNDSTARNLILQSPPNADAVSTVQTNAQANAQTNADENFQLDIVARHITENDYQASTALETVADNTRGVALRVGVFLTARRIDVNLRNVRGQVRFRGSLDSVLERLKLHRNSDPAP